jgi:hypothetical protein
MGTSVGSGNRSRVSDRLAASVRVNLDLSSQALDGSDRTLLLFVLMRG